MSHASPRHDLSGIRFGRIVALRRDINRRGYWIGLCDCGVQKSFAATSLRPGRTTSCGCFQREFSHYRHLKHGHTVGGFSGEYTSWCLMRNRCDNPLNKNYAHYGGRGIAVDERWRDFAVFLADMGQKPTPRMTLDRIDVNGNYEPGNCRWATQKEQTRNKRTNVHLLFRGETKSVAEWAETFGMPYMRLWQRLFKLGWSIDEAAVV